MEKLAAEKAARAQGEKEMGEKLKGILGERLTIEKAATVSVRPAMTTRRDADAGQPARSRSETVSKSIDPLQTSSCAASDGPVGSAHHSGTTNEPVCVIKGVVEGALGAGALCAGIGQGVGLAFEQPC